MSKSEQEKRLREALQAAIEDRMKARAEAAQLRAKLSRRIELHDADGRALMQLSKENEALRNELKRISEARGRAIMEHDKVCQADSGCGMCDALDQMYPSAWQWPKMGADQLGGDRPTGRPDGEKPA